MVLLMRVLLLCLVSNIALGDPLSAAERATYLGPPCKPFNDLLIKAVNNAARQHAPKPSEEDLDRVARAGKASSGMTEANFQRCYTLMRKSKQRKPATPK